MSDIRRSNEEQHLRRNPFDEQGKISGGGGDVTGEEAEQVDDWAELVAEGEGRVDSDVMDDVGNAQDAVFGTTGMLDDVQRPLYDHPRGREQLEDQAPPRVDGEQAP